jgi:hypothetical protein
MKAVLFLQPGVRGEVDSEQAVEAHGVVSRRGSQFLKIVGIQLAQLGTCTPRSYCLAG